LAGNSKSKEALGGILRNFRKDRLNLTQGALARKLGVRLSTLAMWESGGNKLPMGMLVKLADVAANCGPDYDKDCIFFLEEAGVFTPGIKRVLDNEGSPRTVPYPSGPGNTVPLPLLDPASGPFISSPIGQSVELPASLIREPGSAICVMNDATMGAPFDPGGLVVIDQSTTDLDVLLDEELPVAIHYSRGTTLRFFPTSPAVPGIRGALVRLVLPYGPAGVTDYESGTGEKAHRPGIWVGWLSRQQRRLQGEAVQECVLLCTPTVPNVWGGGALEITKWYPQPRQHGGKPAQSDLVAEGLCVLGRVVLWVPKWTPTDKGILPKAKSRKGPK